MSSGPRFPLARWADRSPRVRYSIILVGLLVLWGLAGFIAPGVGV